jgi:hypothetical protein
MFAAARRTAELVVEHTALAVNHAHRSALVMLNSGLLLLFIACALGAAVTAELVTELAVDHAHAFALTVALHVTCVKFEVAALAFAGRTAAGVEHFSERTPHSADGRAANQIKGFRTEVGFLIITQKKKR